MTETELILMFRDLEGQYGQIGKYLCEVLLERDNTKFKYTCQILKEHLDLCREKFVGQLLGGASAGDPSGNATRVIGDDQVRNGDLDINSAPKPWAERKAHKKAGISKYRSLTTWPTRKKRKKTTTT
jgi:hypothetical protein